MLAHALAQVGGSCGQVASGAGCREREGAKQALAGGGAVGESVRGLPRPRPASPRMRRDRPSTLLRRRSFAAPPSAGRGAAVPSRAGLHPALACMPARPLSPHSLGTLLTPLPRSSRRCCSWKSWRPSCSPRCCSGSACRSAQVRGRGGPAWGVAGLGGVGSGAGPLAGRAGWARAAQTREHPPRAARRAPAPSYPCPPRSPPAPPGARRDPGLCGEPHGARGGRGRCLLPGRLRLPGGWAAAGLSCGWQRRLPAGVGAGGGEARPARCPCLRAPPPASLRAPTCALAPTTAAPRQRAVRLSHGRAHPPGAQPAGQDGEELPQLCGWVHLVLLFSEL